MSGGPWALTYVFLSRRNPSSHCMPTTCKCTEARGCDVHSLVPRWAGMASEIAPSRNIRKCRDVCRLAAVASENVRVYGLWTLEPQSRSCRAKIGAAVQRSCHFATLCCHLRPPTRRRAQLACTQSPRVGASSLKSTALVHQNCCHSGQSTQRHFINKRGVSAPLRPTASLGRH